MDLLREQFRYHAWATLQLIDSCMAQPPEALQALVVGTDRSLLHTLTHLVGTEQWYLEMLTGEPATAPIRQGETLPLAELRPRCQPQAQRWEQLLDRFTQLDIAIPADNWRPAIPHGQNLLVVQALQHGIDHRTQICTTLRVLGLEPPIIDGWFYWDAAHPSPASHTEESA